MNPHVWVRITDYGSIQKRPQTTAFFSRMPNVGECVCLHPQTAWEHDRLIFVVTTVEHCAMKTPGDIAGTINVKSI